MAGVKLFGRKWSVSTDDWVFPSLFELLLRIVWFVVLIAVLYSHWPEISSPKCKSGEFFLYFFVTLSAIIAINIPCTLGLMLFSCRGSIIRGRSKREPWVPLFLYLKLFLYFCEIVAIGLGFYWAFYDESDCSRAVVMMVRVIVGLTLLFLLFNIIYVVIIFDPLGAASSGKSADTMVKSQKIWERRCRALCCGCAPKDREKDAFSSIAHILTEYFAALELTPTDIAAGLLLLRQRQEHFVGDVRPPLPETPSPDEQWLSLARIKHVMNFANACYGWPVYMMMNFCQGGCCRLCGLCRCCCCADPADSEIVIDDNCCQCNFAAVQKLAGLNRSSILRATFHNDLFESPYFLAVDEASKTLVLAVRGSLSLKDALTDMSAEVGDLALEDYPEFLAHSGILISARYIHQNLLKNDFLAAAFRRHRGYGLTLTGHSLGAGIVSVLAVLLKGDYPDLKAYAFSPPLGLMNKPMAEFCEDFVVSVCLGFDLVPRLSIRNMYALKEDVKQVLNGTEQPKYKIMAGCLFRLCCACRSGARDLSRSFSSMGESANLVPNDPELAIDPEPANLPQQNLLFAGRMLHIVYAEDNFYRLSDDEQDGSNDVAFRGGDLCSIFGNQRKFKAVWSNADHFQEIIINPRMVIDHLPDRVLYALEQLAANIPPERPF